MLRGFLEWILTTDPTDDARRQSALELALRTCWTRIL